MDKKAAALQELERRKIPFTLAAFHHFAWGDHPTDVDDMRLMLDVGMPVDSVEVGGKTALMIAAGEGHEDTVRLLLGAGADPRRATSAGGTALHSAAIGGRDGVVGLLLEAGADPRARDERGHTPLHWWPGEMGCEPMGDDEEENPRPDPDPLAVIEALLAAGARVDERNNDGTTPFLRALSTGEWEIASLLIDRGADVHAVDAKRSGAFHMIAWLCSQSEWREADAEPMIRRLLQMGVDAKSKDAEGYTPAMLVDGKESGGTFAARLGIISRD